ncbi:hypothetical protein GQ43DRAFT_470682 [Delitschia confertaspora ATCC 74209]|uniref:Uncharacterized protein n=1 Tax=Delitschia confertaspora ATCC 74209 TaxID=1513339 RepID=A0A9P4N098_9PLEO|nr:hypothetical protein GQ43DRAFT_470682 [Delitschia confertaspora ATCC 74209]
MSFGFSFNDIVQAGIIARQIKEIWFTKHNRADAHYLQFGRDVAGLDNLLTKFKEAYSEYAKVREIQLGVHHYHTWNEKTMREKQEQEDQVGGFRETLQDCQDLLNENGRYLTKKANAWDNAKWHLFSGKERADKLRARIQFHCTKISVFMQTISVSVQAAANNALRDIRLQIEALPLRVLNEILAGLSGRPRKDGLHPIMPALHEQYMIALSKDKPDAFIDVSCFPLKEGLDALANALEQSTIKFTGDGLGIWRPTVQQLNNLIKARWIFDRMRESTQLREAGPDSLWRWCLESVQEQIKMEYAKNEQAIIDEEANIASLDEECFRIWMPPLETTAVSVTEPDESQHEEKILEVSLAYPGHSRRELIVFRRPRNELRLVTITTPNVQANSDGIIGITPAPHEDPKVVNMHKVAIVPRYALPSQQGVSYSRIIELCFPGASSGYTYQFKMDEDLWKFQQALLGYKIVYDNSNIRWAIHRALSWGRTEKVQGVGRIQIWQAKPLAASNAQENPSSLLPTSPSIRQSRTDSIHSNSTFASTVRPTSRILGPDPEEKNFVALQRPVLPLLVIFAEVHKKPTFLVLKLEQKIDIHPSRCDCGSTDSRKLLCRRTVLESSSSKFSLHQHSACPDAPSTGLSSWNIALFGHPRHPKVDALAEKVKGVKWMSLDTQTPEEREEFQTCLKVMEKLRDRDQKRYEQQEAEIERQAERPLERKERRSLGVPPTDTLRRYSSMSNPSVSPTSTPSLRPESLVTSSMGSQGEDKPFG